MKPDAVIDATSILHQIVPNPKGSRVMLTIAQSMKLREALLEAELALIDTGPPRRKQHGRA